MAAVRTTTGTLVKAKLIDGKDEPALTTEEAEAIAKERNGKAVEAGLKVRYEVTDK